MSNSSPSTPVVFLLSSMLNNNQFHSGQSKYSDEICAHAYALFQNGKYADCTLTVKTPTKSHRFNLHKIMLSRVMTVEGDDITITTLDPKITREGLHIALGHIYSAYSYNILVNNKNLLAETLAAATLLSLDDLQSIALDLISSDISSGTLLDYLHSPHPQIEGAIYCYLTKSVVEQGWPMKDSEEYGMLVAFFSQLPFEWLKRVVESRDFAVPSEIERFV